MLKRDSIWPGNLLVLGLSLIVACWVTWPTINVFDTAIPCGDSQIATVPGFNAWTMWWNATQLEREFEHYWDAPIFAPAMGTFAFSEPQPFTLIVAPILRYGSLAAAYNFYLCLSVVFNCFAGYWFLRARCNSGLIPVGGAVAVGLHPLAIGNLEAVQLLPIWAILWSVHSVIRLGESLSWKYAFHLALSLSLTTWMCIHHALFLVILMPSLFIAEWYSVRPDFKKFFALVGAAVTIHAIIGFPLLWPMRTILRQNQFERSHELVQALSADWSDWFAVEQMGFAFSPWNDSMHLCPGVLRCLLAAVAVGYAVRRRDVSTVVLSVLAIASLGLSFGANLNLAGLNLWSVGTDTFPILRLVRSPYRFAYFTQMAVILLCFLQLDAWLKANQIRLQKSKPGAIALAYFAFWVATFESIPQSNAMYRLPTIPENTQWLRVLQRHESHGSVLCLPVAENATEASFETSTRWMLIATQHGRSLRNGYSGFIPDSWSALRSEIVEKGLSSDLLDQLAASGTKFVLVRNGEFEVTLGHQPRLKKAAEDAFYTLWKID